MSMISPDSLADTLDSLAEADFHGLTLAAAVKREAAKWLAARCGESRSYAGMPAPTAKDYHTGIRVFTGEKITTGAGTGHVLGEEACRAIRLLDVPLRSVNLALKTARESIHRRVKDSEARGGPAGFFCCGPCTAALWRNLSAGGFPEEGRLLPAGLAALKDHRDGKGRWRRFPFHYTLLALLDMDHAATIAELRYTAGSCERSIKASRGKDVYASRRVELMTRVLERC